MKNVKTLETQLNYPLEKEFIVNLKTQGNYYIFEKYFMSFIIILWWIGYDLKTQCNW